MPPYNQGRYWFHIDEARSFFAQNDTHKRILLDGITHVKGTITGASDVLINSSQELKQDISPLTKEKVIYPC